MPTDVENLTVQSTGTQRGQAVSSCISQMLSEHPDWTRDRAVAACISMADKSMGTRESRAT